MEGLKKTVGELQEERAKLIESAESATSELEKKDLKYLALKEQNMEFQELRTITEQNELDETFRKLNETLEKKIEMLEAEVERKETEMENLSSALSALKEEKVKLSETAESLEKRSEEAEEKLKESRNISARNVLQSKAEKQSLPLYYVALGTGCFIILLFVGFFFFKGRTAPATTGANSPIEIVVDAKQYSSGAEGVSISGPPDVNAGGSRTPLNIHYKLFTIRSWFN